ncbi:unnamed protein product [Hymenolepis diminuta]|uniref:Uncharacterized protein n=1 Tax=Hymenolepis diminuta TaxID=6216 RepID=A0A564YZG4_HYMDI|nr:unnamed protein product [Hymenolepis diminuta]
MNKVTEAVFQRFPKCQQAVKLPPHQKPNPWSKTSCTCILADLSMVAHIL